MVWATDSGASVVSPTPRAIAAAVVDAASVLEIFVFFAFTDFFSFGVHPSGRRIFVEFMGNAD